MKTRKKFTISYRTYDSPLGKMILGENEGRLCLSDFFTSDGDYGKNTRRLLLRINGELTEDQNKPLLDEATRQLDLYFTGKLRNFDLPFIDTGSDFALAVRAGMRAIPYGESRSYAELAREAGHPGSFRAAGGAVGANPLLVFFPCHRVRPADGSLGGFAAGQRIKAALTALEEKFADKSIFS